MKPVSQSYTTKQDIPLKRWMHSARTVLCSYKLQMCCNIDFQQSSLRRMHSHTDSQTTYNLLTNMAIYTEKQRQRKSFSDDESA